jgi:membrane protein DedA with SNARE-associated domain
MFTLAFQPTAAAALSSGAVLIASSVSGTGVSLDPFALLNDRIDPLQEGELVWAMLLIAAATLISEDLACISAGLLVARGTIGLVPAVVASYTGILIGDILLYLAGRYIGQPALGRAPLKWLLREEEVARATHWFSAKGPGLIITSRFLPGSRLPTYFSAGMLGTGFWRFTLYFGIAAALWTPILVGVSALVGNRMFVYFDTFRSYGMMIVVATILLIWLMVKLVIPLFSFRGRRLLLSSFRRKTRWEFWPPYVFYIPVAAYVLFLGLKYRSLTLFTAANPGIPDGGFIGESKSQILHDLRDDGHFVARFDSIGSNLSAEAKIVRAEKFMEAIHTDFPVVVKPDAGERGRGVSIIRSDRQLADALAGAVDDCIIQEFVDGLEFGVFYYRYPHETAGHIFSITDKRLPTVVGDGHSTLEDLILRDDRAVCMAPFHLRNHRDRLDEVLRPGEIFHLVEIGTHCRGALFLDGRAVQTPALVSAVDAVSQRYDGFFFGRYDIRTRSLEDFRQGRNFKIVELNGVTSEATHIYQPGNSIWYAYRTLMRQWRLAFDIGAANRRRGFLPSPASRLFKLLFH